ncbi:MAG: hypothetical protein OCU16_04250 [Candidatus Methanospirare jalkutatii]|nr:hypothetical protein [Candidatus Methanospirare jalkutatii]
MQKELGDIIRKMIERAKNYPFDIPNYSYVFINGNAFKLVKFNLHSLMDSIIQVNEGRQKLRRYLHLKKIDLSLDFPDCFPVLAYGSNASFMQLQEKFSNFNDHVVIPVIKAYLFDFDVVYSAHYSPYGSIPATLQYSPKTVVKTFVAYLTKPQLDHLHETEKNYCFGKLFNIQLVLENNAVLREIFAYLSLHNCLYINGTHIALSAINAKNRIFPQMNEVEVLTLVRDIIEKDKDLDTFILENIRNPKIREERIKKLKLMSRKFSYKYWKVQI